MKVKILLACVIVVLAACNKDKFTTEPQIKYKSLSPNICSSTVLNPQSPEIPRLTISVTDSEGDLGITGSDTARIYIRNLLTNSIDSFDFPDLNATSKPNFKGDVEVNLFNALECRSFGPPRPRTDTTYFEVYIKDFAGNKSNVIKTDDPLFYICE